MVTIYMGRQKLPVRSLSDYDKGEWNSSGKRKEYVQAKSSCISQNSAGGSKHKKTLLPQQSGPYFSTF